MPDLKDGESMAMQGSGKQALHPQECRRRVFLHLPRLAQPVHRHRAPHLQAPAQAARRCGRRSPRRQRPATPAKATAQDDDSSKAPPLLLAERWDNVIDPTGWWLSEKLDGVRAYWDGKQFWSRLGNLFHAPDWFVAGLPTEPLDGELWLDRKQFQRTVSIVRRQDKSDHWKQVRYVVFDAPKLDKDFEKRLALVQECLASNRPAYALAHEHQRCHGLDHLRTELDRLEALGAEGLMLRQAGSRYESGRSSTLLKVKRFHDSRGQGAPAPARGGPAQGPAGGLAGRAARRHHVCGGHRLLRRRAREPAALGQHDHLPLPGAFGRRAFPGSHPMSASGPTTCLRPHP